MLFIPVISLSEIYSTNLKNVIPKEKISANSGLNSPMPLVFPSQIYFSSGDI